MSIVVNKTRLPVTQWQTESGSVVSISDARKRYAKSLSVALEPIQDLHGYANPWVGGAGKNKFNQSDSDSLAVDVSVYALNDAKALAQLNTLQAGTYTLTWKAKIVQISPTATNPTIGRYGLYFRATNNGVNFNVNGQLDVANPTSGQIITKSVKFTLTSDYVGKFASFWIYCGRSISDGNPDTCNLYDVQIESGSTATAFEPYENLCPISGRSSVTAVRCGKNLLSNGTITKVGNTYFIGGTSGSDYPFYLRAGTYTASNAGTASYMYWQKKGTSINNIIHNGSTTIGTFTLAEDGYYRFWFYSLDADASFTDIQIEHGSTAIATYEPYQGISVTLSLGQTVYGGSVDLVSGVLTVEKAMLTFSSAYLYGTYDSGTGKGTFWYVTGQPELNSVNDGVICNRLRVDGNVNVNSSDGLISFFTNKIIRWTEQRSLSKTDYNTWLANNPLQVVYRLKEPQTIQLSPNQIEMLMRNNTVWSDAGLVTLEYARIRQ